MSYYLSDWLENAGPSNAAIAQFKFNVLAVIYPELKEVAELAKSAIGLMAGDNLRQPFGIAEVVDFIWS